jgi:serine/threonine protein kinase
MSTPLPQTFGRYVLRERVGQGGMAEVFRATLAGFGGFERPIAIKRMFRDYGSDPAFVEMLTDEAKIVCQLAHPNIVSVLDAGEQDGYYYLAFEYIDGVDLFRLLQRHHETGRSLPVGLAAYIVAELCAALDHAHGRLAADGSALGIVHRDVSPQNVLLSLAGEVKLTDFGIAKAALRYTHTQAGLVKGKIYYMSPEQVLGQPIDHRSDLFAAGILLYECLTTQPLYNEVDTHKLYDLVSTANYQWPDDQRARVPEPLLAVVTQALQVSPAARFASGRAMREAIVVAMQRAGIVADREAFARYLRETYGLQEGRPSYAPVQPPRLTSHHQDERWNSQVSQVPVAMGDDPTHKSPNRPARVPLPKPAGLAPPQPQQLPSPAVASAKMAPLRTTGSNTPPPPVAVPPVAVPAVAVPPVAVPAVAVPAQPRPTQPRPLSEGVSPVRPNLRATGSTPAPRPTPAVPRPRPLSGAVPVPAEAKRTPAPTPVADDDSTAMLDQAEMARRIAEAAIADAAAPDSEAATRFTAAMADDAGDDTTKPRPKSLARRVDPPARRPSSSPSSSTPSSSSLSATFLPEPAVALDPDDQPASWQLLLVTSLVWAGVLMMAVYATLMSLS